MSLSTLTNSCPRWDNQTLSMAGVLAINENQLAAVQGNKIACNLEEKVGCVFNYMQLGNAHWERGDGQHAISCYRLAAAKGHQPAMHAINQLKPNIDEKEYAAILQLFNQGVKQRIAFYRQQADAGDVAASEMLESAGYRSAAALSTPMSEDKRLFRIADFLHSEMKSQIYRLEFRRREYLNYWASRDYWDSLMEYVDPDPKTEIGILLGYFAMRKNSGLVENLKQAVDSNIFSGTRRVYEKSCKNEFFREQYIRYCDEGNSYTTREPIDTLVIKTLKFLRRNLHSDVIVNKIKNILSMPQAFINNPTKETLKMFKNAKQIMTIIHTTDIENDFMGIVRERAARGDAAAIQLLKENK